jgi:hypothetical protein
MAFVRRPSDFANHLVYVAGIFARRESGTGDYQKPGYYIKPESGGRKPVLKTNKINGQVEHCMSGVYFLYYPLESDPMPPGGSCNSIEITI